MKSSQVMARIEAAGWKRIRGEGSHFTYERHGKRALYAYGRPQSEIGKVKLRDIERRFNLKEIEQEVHTRHVSQGLTRAQVSVRNTTDHIADEMTDQTARLLFTQLHRDHKVRVFDVSGALKIGTTDLVNYLHHGKALKPSDRSAFWVWLGEQEHKLDLTRDRNALLDRGYGARTGSSNAIDPFLEKAREALKTALVGKNKQTDLARAIGVAPSVIGGILNDRSKTIYPDNKRKIQQWITDNDIEVAAPTSIDPDRYPVPDMTAFPVRDVLASEPATDPEMDAIQKTWTAVRGLSGPAARRVLNYVTDRITD